MRKEERIMRELSGALAFDSSVLIEMVFSSEMGREIVKLLINDIILAYTTEIALTELEYILCRRIGIREARDRVNKLLKSGYVNVIETSKLRELAAEYKCRRAISLADSFLLALSKYLKIPALFARREKELIKEIEREPFDVIILFLEDYLKGDR